MGGLEQTSPTNIIFFSMTKVKTCWKAILIFFWKIECKKIRINDFPIVYHEKDEHTPWWNDPYHTHVHLHGHRNKVMPFMKLFILADLNNGVKFHNYIY
jgi:hypothetical protein